MTLAAEERFSGECLRLRYEDLVADPQTHTVAVAGAAQVQRSVMRKDIKRDLRPCWHGGQTRTMDECQLTRMGGQRVRMTMTCL